MSSILLKNINCNGILSDICIEGTRIKKIVPVGGCSGGHIEIASGVEVMDCEGKTAMPAFINMHTHAAMSLMRGIEEDVQLHEWLDKIWKTEARIDEEFVYWGTKVACLEMIKTGTVTFNDQYWYSLAARKAAVEMGLRPVVSYVALDHNHHENTERQKEQMQEVYEKSLAMKDNGIFETAIHAIYSTSEELMLWVTEFARNHGLKIHIQISETEKEAADCK